MHARTPSFFCRKDIVAKSLGDKRLAKLGNVALPHLLATSTLFLVTKKKEAAAASALEAINAQFDASMQQQPPATAAKQE